MTRLSKRGDVADMPPQARRFGAPVCFQQDSYLC